MGASSIAISGVEYQHDMELSISVEVDDEPGECDACHFCNDVCEVDSCISCQKKRNNNAADNRQLVERGGDVGWFMGAFASICQNTFESQDNENNEQQQLQQQQQARAYTMCQLRRHNHADSAWILVGTTIYDATPYIKSHPGGIATILRKSGGAADCTEDLRFHSKRAQKEWRKFKVGTLSHCPHCR